MSQDEREIRRVVGSEVASEPAGEPSGEPAGEPSGEPAGEPASEPTRQKHGVAGALLRGAAAGAIGALAMTLTHRGAAATVLPGGTSMPDPAQSLAREAVEHRGGELTDSQAAAAGTALSVGFGALLGAAYGLVQDQVHPPSVVHGLALAALSYAVTVPERGVLPRLGIRPPPTEQPLEEASIPLMSHLAFGITTAAAFEAIT